MGMLLDSSKPAEPTSLVVATPTPWQHFCRPDFTLSSIARHAAFSHLVATETVPIPSFFRQNPTVTHVGPCATPTHSEDQVAQIPNNETPTPPPHFSSADTAEELMQKRAAMTSALTLLQKNIDEVDALLRDKAHVQSI